MELNFPHGIDVERFLAEYWQRRPLLFRAALPGYQCPIDPEELAGLACESEVEARIVLERAGKQPWEVWHGPFDEAHFAALPDSHWTLLVQDVDKHVPEVAGLLDGFRFIPGWRIDDVLVSYAVDQGSVGPHVDEYDVFLFQAKGRRRWRVNTAPTPPDAHIPDLELKILPQFEAEHEWLLEPGDMLYLPPGVAHWGVAEEDCMTCSVGFRAPSLNELGNSLVDYLLDQRLPEGRYRDPPLHPQPSNAEILPGALAPIRDALRQTLALDEDTLRRWFGRFNTEPKPNLTIEPQDEPVPAQTLLTRLREQGRLSRDSYSRLAFVETGDAVYVFANGEEYPLDRSQRSFAVRLTDTRELRHVDLALLLGNPECMDLLTTLYNAGHFHLADD